MFSKIIWACSLHFLFISLDSTAQVVQNFSGSFEDRIGFHLTNPQSISTNFQSLLLEQRLSSNNLSGVFAARAWYEGAYINDGNEYPSDLAKFDSHDFAVRDFYVQYKNENLFVRLGNQQVVWGEAFGFFYSDIVNPKDFRDGGFRDFEEVRRPIPMLNLKYTLSQFSIQGIYVPKPYFNVNPLPGSDFAFPFTSYVGINQIEINRSDSDDIRVGHDEYGGRASLNLGGIDTSVFIFSYLDRAPYYQVDPTSALPASLTLDELHSRIVSTGVTASFDFESFVFRMEAVNTRNRNYANVTTNSFGVPQLGHFTSDENVFVIGVDAPTWEQINLGIQYSENKITQYTAGLLRPQDESLLSLRVSRPFFDRQSAQIIYAYQVSDGGTLVQLQYLVPAYDNFEFKIGSDLFNGSNMSPFGEMHRATRVYTSIKYWFKSN